MQAVEADSRIIRPLNFAKTAPGRGYRLFEATNGRKVLVLQVLGQGCMRRGCEDPPQYANLCRREKFAGFTVGNSQQRGDTSPASSATMSPRRAAAAAPPRWLVR